MKCQFVTIGDNIHQCSVCGFTIQINESPDRIQKKCNPPTPGIAQKVENFATAMKDWVAAGAPLTSTEEKNDRMEICKKCDAYDNGTCKLCGCGLALKTRLETSHCPIGKW